jgi:hypothetical protein
VTEDRGAHAESNRISTAPIGKTVAPRRCGHMCVAATNQTKPLPRLASQVEIETAANERAACD